LSPPGRLQASGSTFSEFAVALLVIAVAVLVFFAPALFSGGSLAPGDGAISYLPNFERGDGSMWIDDIYGGYAAALDPQLQRFYLPFWLSPTYPIFVLIAYLSAALGSYGCARALSGSRLGATVAALMVGFGGFMTAHLGHATIIHAAAWIPWLLWAVHALSQSRSVWPLLGGAFATNLCLGGGHPQISIMGLLLAGFYALSLLQSCAVGQRQRFLLRATAMFALGLTLAAPILAGYYATSVDSVRGAWTESDFNSYSYTLSELALLGFPNLYGAHPPGPYGPYAGPFNLTELTAYIGWLPWLLMPLLFASVRVWVRSWFWIVAACAALLLMFGTLSPLGRLAYELPVLGQFRAQARFGIVLCICLAMASAMALAAVERGELPLKRARAAFGIGILLLVGLAGAFAWHRLPPGEISAQVWFRLGLPLGLAVLTSCCLALLLHNRSRIARGLLPLLFLADLSSFGWFYEWRDALPLSELGVSAAAAESLNTIAASGTRVLPREDSHSKVTPLIANVNLMYGVPLVTGYGPLADPQYLRLARASTSGGIALPPPDAAILDLLRVGWIAGGSGPAETHLIGSGCGAEGSPAGVSLSVPRAAQWLRVTSHVACGVNLANGAPVARLFESVVDRENVLGVLRAGIETAEWAHARADVRAVVRHGLPLNEIPFQADGFLGYWYVATLQLGANTDALAQHRLLSLSSMAPGSPLRIKAVEYSQDGLAWQGATAVPLRSGFHQRFEELARVQGLPRLLRRLSMPPEHWMPCSVQHGSLDEINARLWGSGDNRLDVQRVLLVTADEGVAAGTCSGARTSRLIDRSPGRVSFLVDEGTSRALVLATTFHRGWRASSNGQSLPVLRAYGLNLGVIVPAGAQQLVFEFAPPELGIAFIALVLGLLGASGLLAVGMRQSLLASRVGVSV
jgi:hypothetical protein